MLFKKNGEVKFLLKKYLYRFKIELNEFRLKIACEV